MDKTVDILPVRSGASVCHVTEDLREDDHRCAQERVLAYLKALGVPEQKAADCAAEAMQRAGRETGMHPIAAAMQALRAVLSEDQRDMECAAQQIFSRNSSDGAGQITSMPPLNRDSMLAVELDRKPWWTFFTKYILRKKP
jgi:hypothetical protein